MRPIRKNLSTMKKKSKTSLLETNFSIIAESDTEMIKTHTMQVEKKMIAKNRLSNKNSIPIFTKNINYKKQSRESNSSNTATKYTSSKIYKDTTNSKSSHSELNTIEIMVIPSPKMKKKSPKACTNATNSIRTSLTKSSESITTNTFNSIKVKKRPVINSQKVNLTNIKLKKIVEAKRLTPLKVSQAKKISMVSKTATNSPKIPLNKNVSYCLFI
jgi:hypothetical protein